MANRTLKTVSTYQDAPLFDKTVGGLLNQGWEMYQPSVYIDGSFIAFLVLKK